MAHEQHTYICIDLKTFYASVECVDRGLDPLTTNLVVRLHRVFNAALKSAKQLGKPRFVA